MDRNLEALYEISRYLKMPAESAPPSVYVPREVRERYDRMLDALARLAGAFSAVVRNTPGRMVMLTGHDTGNPLSFPAYAEAMRIINGEKP